MKKNDSIKEEKAMNEILNYYLFQKKIKNFLNKKNFLEDNNKIEMGYIINRNYINQWKNTRNYEYISIGLDDAKKDTTKNKLDKKQKKEINQFIEQNHIKYNHNIQFIEENKFIVDSFKKIISEDDLENLIDKVTFKELNINKNKISYEKVGYIFKKKILIIFIEEIKVIKLILHYSNCNDDKIINLVFNFSFPEQFKKYHNFFEKQNSEKIIEYLLKINIFNESSYIEYNKNNDITLIAYNIDKYIDSKVKSNKPNSNINKLDSKEYNNDEVEIKEPYQINFSLINELSFRGLDNVGATCYMNATLQCLANIKPITTYLLSPENYFEFHSNYTICLLTLEYIQVLIGLFCDESRNGSYCPKFFKKTISEMNPLFKGVKVKDSKDLIILLLEVMNNELVKINKKKYNIIDNDNKSYQIINI